MKNKTKMLISSTVAIIFTTITLGYLITWVFHLYPTFLGYIPSYFGTIVFYGFISAVCWLVARGYYLDSEKETKTNTKNT